MFGWSDIIVQRERYTDLLREAERERLIRRMLAGRRGPGHLYRRILAALGQRMVAWGCRLQARYGAAGAAVRPQACRPGLANR